MRCEKPLPWMFLSRALLMGALLSIAPLAACGSESPGVGTDDDSANEDDDADDDVGDDDTDPPAEDDDTDPPAGDDDDDDDVAKPPMGGVDAGPQQPPKADAAVKTDSSTPSRTDSSTPSGGDAGPDTGKTDGGDTPDPVTPSGDCYCRGEAPTQQSASARGKYPVKEYTSGFGNAPEYADATIHYPDSPDAKPPFAIVSVVPGFVSPQSSIKPWGPFLASHGIVTMTIGTNSTSDQPPARATALLGALKTLEAENAREGSPLKGKLDLKRQAVMGWSMGGGGALLAAERKTDLMATVSLCGWNPGYRYAKIKSPALMFAATSDPLAGGQSQGFYSSIPNETPKMLFEVSGGSHQIANNPASLSYAIGRYGLSWMRVYVEKDDRYKQFLTAGKPQGTAAFMTNVK